MTDPLARAVLVILHDEDAHTLERLLRDLPFPAARTVVAVEAGAGASAAICRAATTSYVEVGAPFSEARSVNAGADLAHALGAEYQCVMRSNVRFHTDVFAECVAALARDPALAMVAPSAIVVDGSLAGCTVAHRAAWDLESVSIVRETLIPPYGCTRLDADLCDFTCAVLRASALEEIGRCDEAYVTGLAAADLCFRLRRAGHGLAALPKSQIELVSRFDPFEWGGEAVDADRRRFAGTHLGRTVRYRPSPSDRAAGGDVLDRTLERYALAGDDGPALALRDRGWAASDGDAARPRDRPALPADAWWMPDRTALASRSSAILMPPGVETDVFHPWGRVERYFEEPTFLAVVNGWDARALRVLRQAWHGFRATESGARLVVLGRGLVDAVGEAPATVLRVGRVDVARYEAERLDVHELLSPPADADIADVFRSVDVLVCPAGGATPCSTLWQARACGTPALLMRDDATADDGPPAVEGGPVPDETGLAEAIAAAMRRSLALGPAERAALGEAGFASVSAHHTWRRRVMSLHSALAELEPSRSSGGARVERASRGSPLDGTSRSVARRVQTLGRFAERLGAAWEREGLAAAGRLASFEVRTALRDRGEPPGRGTGPSVARTVRRARAAVARHRPGASPRPDAALLIGYIEGRLGLGQSLRGLAQALDEAGAPFGIYPVAIGIEDRRTAPFLPERYDVRRTYGVNIVEVSGDELPRVLRHVGGRHFDRSYTILRGWWELGRAPEAWRPNLAAIDEIWAPNAFVADAFRAIFDKTITIVPPCVERPEPGGEERPAAGTEPFTFLFTFDFQSYPQRKNPLGVVRAFREAFKDPSLPVRLVVKSTGAPHPSVDVERALRAAAAEDGRIAIRDEHLSRPDMLDLIRTADCYVSLHRSEGFGLGMAEAMAFGRPVIGTNYSGNTDFLSERTGYPVDFELCPLGPGDYAHGQGQRWAEPDLGASVAALRRVFHHRDEAAARAAAGRELILRRYAPATVGRRAAARLAEIFTARRRGDGDGAIR